MGCGSSRGAQVVSPLNEAVVLPHPGWDAPNGGLKSLVMKESSQQQMTGKERRPSVAEAAVQTIEWVAFADKNIQTDTELYPEELLEMLMEEDADDEYLGADIADEETQTTSLDTADTVKSVLVQTEQRIMFLANESSQLDMTKSDSKVTIDIGIQVYRMRTDHFTQTDRRAASRLSNARSSRLGSRPPSEQQGAPPIAMKPAKCLPVYPSTSRLGKADFESQTDPVLRAPAANAAASDTNVLHAVDVSSPFAHIEKELTGSSAVMDRKLASNNQTNIHESLVKLLEDMEDTLRQDPDIVTRMGLNDAAPRQEVAVQTDNDPITDEAPEYAARPPPCKKKEMIPNMTIFKDTDRRALEAPESAKSSLKTLVRYLTLNAPNDIHKIRALFRWIANNIKYDWKYMEVKMTADEVLEIGEGVCKDYCKLFSEMCRLCGIRVKTIQGFAKGYDYRPGHQFQPGEDITHAWNAIFILGSWRLIDTTWGTGFTDHTGKFQRKLNEHFFLTDPEVLIWTHFPYDEVESDYSRWQLVDKPLTLEEFNALPKVTPHFFEFNLKIRSRPQNPVVFRVQKEVKLAAHEPMRYKYKLYPADEVENSSLNNYVFCQLKEDRLVGSFTVTPPVEGRYYFKVYAKPEREMQEDTSLQNVVIFLLECQRARKYLLPYPQNEVPWGPTQAFYDYKMKLHNQAGPVIVSWGGKRKLTLEGQETMLVTIQVFDADGMEMDIKSFINREDHDKKVHLTVTPPRVGMFKLVVFGMPKPKQKGKWRLPLIASFLIDCKLTKQVYDEEFPPPQPRPPPEEEKEDKKDKKERGIRSVLPSLR